MQDVNHVYTQSNQLLSTNFGKLSHDYDFKKMDAKSTAAIEGMLDNFKYNSWCCMEYTYAMKILINGDSFFVEGCRIIGAIIKTFQYSQPHDGHIHYCNMSDNHNE